MDLVRRSRRRAHVGVRRHVPHQSVDVHLRRRLPGRAHRAGARARAGLLLVRRALHRQGRPRDAPSGWPSKLTADEWQFKKQSDRRGGPIKVNGRRRVGHPPRRRRLHLPQPPGVRRPAPAARCTRRRCAGTSVRSTGSRRSAGSCRCAASTRPTRTATSRRRVREWKRRDWGEGGDEFHWWCTDSHEAFVGQRTRVRDACATSSSRLVGETPYRMFVEPGPSAGTAPRFPIQRSRCGASRPK